MIGLIALLFSLPPALAGLIFGRRKPVIITAIITGIIGISTGNPSLAWADALAVAIGFFIGMFYTQPAPKAPAPPPPPPAKQQLPPEPLSTNRREQLSRTQGNPTEQLEEKIVREQFNMFFAAVKTAERILSGNIPDEIASSKDKIKADWAKITIASILEQQGASSTYLRKNLSFYMMNLYIQRYKAFSLYRSMKGTEHETGDFMLLECEKFLRIQFKTRCKADACEFLKTYPLEFN